MSDTLYLPAAEQQRLRQWLSLRVGTRQPVQLLVETPAASTSTRKR